MTFADIQDVRFAADTNSYCGGRVARRLVKDRILPAHVADGVWAEPSQFGHSAKGSCAFRSVDQCRVPGPDLLIRHRPVNL